MERRFFLERGIRGGLGFLITGATACTKDNHFDIFTPRNTLDDYLKKYTPLVENLYYNKQESSQFLYSSMLSDAQEVSLDYSRSEGSKVKSTILAAAQDKGDVDNSGKTDIFDLLKLLKILSGREQPTPAADIDGNGIVNIFDLLDLLKILSGTYGKTIYKGSLIDLFSNEIIPEADIEILDCSGNVISTQKAKNGSYNVSLESSNDSYRLIFTAQNFFQHISSLLQGNISLTNNLGLVPSSFNMALFDIVVRSGNNQPDATTRWMTVPKFYIVNGPISGYNVFETPTTEWINELVDIINKDLKTFTGGFINNPIIKIGNDPLGDGAGKEILSNQYGTIINTNNGWISVHYTLRSKDGLGRSKISDN